jgi:hypothetical protein
MKPILPFLLFVLFCFSAESQTPRALHPDIKISLVTKVQAEVTRLAYNPIDSAFYYSTANGNIYKVMMPNSAAAYDTGASAPHTAVP